MTENKGRRDQGPVGKGQETIGPQKWQNKSIFISQKRRAIGIVCGKGVGWGEAIAPPDKILVQNLILQMVLDLILLF